jgi:hypothetical protein
MKNISVNFVFLGIHDTQLVRLGDQAARATDLIARLEQATLAKAFRGDLQMDQQRNTAVSR